MKLTNLTITICLFAALTLASCGHSRWRYSIEQVPAEPTAYLRDGVFVSGEYIRYATISELDGVPVVRNGSEPLSVSLGAHKLKVHCSEAEGKYDTSKVSGKEKTLEFEAEIQRTYLVRCMPYTHWWVEDSENKKIVAGEKPE